MPLIYDIDEWVEQVEKSRNQNKFEIHRMKNKFRNFNQMLEQINMKVSKNVENERFNWLNLQWFKVEGGSFYVQYRTMQEGPIHKIQFKQASSDFPDIPNSYMYSQGVPIKTAKYNDLQSLIYKSWGSLTSIDNPKELLSMLAKSSQLLPVVTQRPINLRYKIVGI